MVKCLLPCNLTCRYFSPELSKLNVWPGQEVAMTLLGCVGYGPLHHWCNIYPTLLLKSQTQRARRMRTLRKWHLWGGGGRRRRRSACCAPSSLKGSSTPFLNTELRILCCEMWHPRSLCSTRHNSTLPIPDWIMNVFKKLTTSWMTKSRRLTFKSKW